MDNTQLQDRQYIVNTDDGQGNVNVTYQVAGQQYTQDLMNIDDSSGDSLLAAVNAYVEGAIDQLTPSAQTEQVEQDNLASGVQNIIGQIQTVADDAQPIISGTDTLVNQGVQTQ